MRRYAPVDDPVAPLAVTGARSDDPVPTPSPPTPLQRHGAARERDDEVASPTTAPPDVAASAAPQGAGRRARLLWWLKHSGGPAGFAVAAVLVVALPDARAASQVGAFGTAWLVVWWWLSEVRSSDDVAHKDPAS